MDQMRTWCSLCHEILSLILSHLSVGDVIVFHGVCKWWNKTPPPITPLILPVSMPLLLLPSNKLSHPIYKYSYCTEVYELPVANIRASHFGWLLMTVFEKSLFFFNPFTKKKVELPDMPFPYDWPNLTFSSPPTSSDCVVFGVEIKIPSHENMINIYTIKPGEPNWSLNTFLSEPYFQLSSCNPVLFKGLYYCLGKGGSLLTYDFAGKTYEWLGPSEPLFRQTQSFHGCRYYMMESQGDLLLVFTDRDGNSVNVVRYTTDKRIWEKVDNMRDTMLFVSQVSSFSSKSVVRGTGNKIYFPKFVDGTDNQLFYSLGTLKYHCFFLGGRTWSDTIGTRSYANSTWINPYSSS